MARDITYLTRRSVITIRIVPSATGEPARVIFEGSIVNVSDGAPLQAFEEDVTDALPPDQATNVAGLVALAQAWLDAHPPAA
jgi:hypothetical protein